MWHIFYDVNKFHPSSFSYNALWESHINDPARNMIHWGNGGKANNIETTSYALLALVMKAKSERKCAVILFL